MYRLRKRFNYEASHRLAHYDGNCQRLHGHSYTFELEIYGPLTHDGPKQGMAVDYAIIGSVGKGIVALLDHQHLNDVLGTDTPTAEFISKWIYERASTQIAQLWAVTVCETEATSCRYSPKEERAILMGNQALADLEDRFYDLVQTGEQNECWPFMGSKDEGGYGYFRYGAAGINKAHRMAAWLAGRNIEGLVVLHSCDNPPCCNPAHLSTGTHADNEADKDRKGRRPDGERHHATILKDFEVQNFWNQYRAGHRDMDDWSKALGVSKGVLSNIVNGWAWRRITGLEKSETQDSAAEFRG